MGEGGNLSRKKLSKREQKQRKEYVEKLLRIKGIDYDDWLDGQHEKVIGENLDLMISIASKVLGEEIKEEDVKEVKNTISDVNNKDTNTSSDVNNEDTNKDTFNNTQNAEMFR